MKLYFVIYPEIIKNMKFHTSATDIKDINLQKYAPILKINHFDVYYELEEIC